MVGAAFGAVAAAASQRVGGTHVEARSIALALAAMAVGVAVAMLRARRRRFDDVDAALFFDGELGTHELITTARACVDERVGDAPNARFDELCAEATDALERRMRPSLLPRAALGRHAALPIALAACVLAVLRVHAPAGALAGSAIPIVKLEADRLAAVAALASAPAASPADRETLDALSREAEALRRALAEGLPGPDAVDRLDKLRAALDAVAEEPSASSEERAALDGALSTLGAEATTRNAARALGRGDRDAFDAEMERLANARERGDRQRAREALEKAARDARADGANALAEGFEADANAMGRRSARADLLRELARAVAEASRGAEDAGAKEVETMAEALDREGTDAAARALAEALERALAGLDEAERKRLAERLAARANEARRRGDTVADAERLKELAEELGRAGGEERLRDRLRTLANEPMVPDTDRSRRRRALTDAERGLSETERALGRGLSQGGVPLPSPHAPSGGAGANGGQAGRGDGRAGNGDGQAGNGGAPGRGGGAGQHAGETPAIGGGGLQGRARTAFDDVAPLAGSVTTFAPGTGAKAGGAAGERQPGSAELRAAAPRELSGFEQSDVPEEYREQVRRYFQP
jgi:hypothetical protein